MAEQRKRGFHALEDRIHQLEEEDQKAPRDTAPKSGEAPPRQPPQDERPPERKA